MAEKCPGLKPYKKQGAAHQCAAKCPGKQAPNAKNRCEAYVCPTGFKEDAREYSSLLDVSGVAIDVHVIDCKCKDKCSCSIGKKKNAGFTAQFHAKARALTSAGVPVAKAKAILKATRRAYSQYILSRAKKSKDARKKCKEASKSLPAGATPAEEEPWKSPADHVDALDATTKALLKKQLKKIFHRLADNGKVEPYWYNTAYASAGDIKVGLDDESPGAGFSANSHCSGVAGESAKHSHKVIAFQGTCAHAAACAVIKVTKGKNPVVLGWGKVSTLNAAGKQHAKMFTDIFGMAFCNGNCPSAVQGPMGCSCQQDKAKCPSGMRGTRTDPAASPWSSSRRLLDADLEAVGYGNSDPKTCKFPKGCEPSWGRDTAKFSKVVEKMYLTHVHKCNFFMQWGRVQVAMGAPKICNKAGHNLDFMIRKAVSDVRFRVAMKKTEAAADREAEAREAAAAGLQLG